MPLIKELSFKEQSKELEIIIQSNNDDHEMK